MFLGISLNPKPRRKAPVTSPKVFEHAIAKPTIPPSLSKILFKVNSQASGGALKKSWAVLKGNTQILGYVLQVC
jgi:hypothetical protein